MTRRHCDEQGLAQGNRHGTHLGDVSALSAARNLISIAALAHYSLTAVLFPAVSGAACVLFIMLVAHRPRLLVDHRI